MCALTLVFPEKLSDAFSALYGSLFIDANPKMDKVEGWQPVFEKVVGKETADEIVKMVSPLCNPLDA